MTVCSKCNQNHGHFKNGRVRKTCPKSCGGSFITTALTTRPKQVKEFITKYGNQTIKAVKICRKPIIKQIRWLYEHVASKSLAKVKKQYSYDDIFHLFLILYLENGATIRYEKNERVGITYNYVEEEKVDCTEKINVPKIITVEEMINEYEKLGSWRYDAETSNCQYFVRDNCHILGIFQFDHFIKQNLEKVLPTWAHWLANLATDTSALIDYGVRGGSIVSLPPFHARLPTEPCLRYPLPVRKILPRVVLM